MKIKFSGGDMLSEEQKAVLRKMIERGEQHKEVMGYDYTVREKSPNGKIRLLVTGDYNDGRFPRCWITAYAWTGLRRPE